MSKATTSRGMGGADAPAAGHRLVRFARWGCQTTRGARRDGPGMRSHWLCQGVAGHWVCVMVKRAQVRTQRRGHGCGRRSERHDSHGCAWTPSSGPWTSVLPTVAQVAGAPAPARSTASVVVELAIVGIGSRECVLSHTRHRSAVSFVDACEPRCHLCGTAHGQNLEHFGSGKGFSKWVRHVTKVGS